MWFKQSTAATISVGPILDSAGAEYTSAVIGDLTITKNDTSAAMASAATLTHTSNGHYDLVMTTGNTDTLGRLQIRCNKSTYQMTQVNGMVLPAMIYDSIVAGTDRLDTNVTHVADTAQTPRDIGASVLLSSGTGTGQVKLSSGYVAPNWGDVGNPTTTLALTGTTIASTQKVDLETVKTQSVTCAAGVTVNPQVGFSSTNATNLATLAGHDPGSTLASQADINALNQSASRRVILTTVGQYERPESSSTVYTVEARTYSRDGVPMDATGTPTLTATGATSGDLAANLGTITNPATGVYRWAYTVASNATLEPVRFDFSAVVEGDTVPMAVYTQVTDAVAADFTTADRTKLDGIYNKLPSNNIADQTLLTASIGNVETDTQDLQTQIGTAGAGLSAVPKTGYKLASDGLDSVATTAPAGVASNFREMVVQTWRRFFKKATQTSTQLKTYADDGSTVLTTQTLSDDGTTQTQGVSS